MFQIAHLSLLGALQLLAATASATPAADKATQQSDRYSLSFSILQKGRTLAAPEMRVRAGEQATMTVEDKSSGKGYRLTVLAKPVAHPAGKSGDWLEVSAKYSELQKGSWLPKMQPVLVVPVAVQASLPNQAADAQQSSMSLVSSSRLQSAAAAEPNSLRDAAELQLTVSASPAE